MVYLKWVAKLMARKAAVFTSLDSIIAHKQVKRRNKKWSGEDMQSNQILLVPLC
jgi:hypothetical protein